MEGNGARREGKINITCISLAPSGDVNTGQVEKVTKQNKTKKNPRFSTVTCCFLRALSRIRFGAHMAKADFSILCGHMLQKFSC